MIRKLLSFLVDTGLVYSLGGIDAALQAHQPNLVALELHVYFLGLQLVLLYSFLVVLVLGFVGAHLIHGYLVDLTLEVFHLGFHVLNVCFDFAQIIRFVAIIH